MDATLKYLLNTPRKEIRATIRKAGHLYVTDEQLKMHLISQGKKRVGVDGLINMPLGKAVAAMRKTGPPWVKR